MMKTTNKINVDYIAHSGNDLSVVNAARVSFNKVSEELTDKDIKLIHYLAKHKHFSPFNHSFLSFRVSAPIFVARQLVKHKFLPWNEVSRRYVDEEPVFYFPDKWRKRSADKKQGSSDESVNLIFNGKDYSEDIPYDSMWVCLESYQRMIELNVCPEQARMVLPQNMMTEWLWSGTLGAFCDMLRLRLKQDTQKETRDVAEAISKHVKQLFPISYEALLNDHA